MGEQELCHQGITRSRPGTRLAYQDSINAQLPPPEMRTGSRTLVLEAVRLASHGAWEVSAGAKGGPP